MPISYLSSIKTRFQSYKDLGDKTFAQLSDDQLFWQHNEESNNIGIIVKHLWGNMLSRWTNFLTSDGEKDWRQRDAEFENDISGREELLAKWEEGWKCLFNAINALTEEDLSKEIYIRHETLSVVDAINRQLAHYAYHVGQIVFIGKMLCGPKWTSLSIPKNGSKEYNKDKFETQEKDFKK